MNDKLTTVTKWRAIFTFPPSLDYLNDLTENIDHVRTDEYSIFRIYLLFDLTISSSKCKFRG